MTITERKIKIEKLTRQRALLSPTLDAFEWLKLTRQIDELSMVQETEKINMADLLKKMPQGHIERTSNNLDKVLVCCDIIENACTEFMEIINMDFPNLHDFDFINKCNDIRNLSREVRKQMDAVNYEESLEAFAVTCDSVDNFLQKKVEALDRKLARIKAKKEKEVKK